MGIQGFHLRLLSGILFAAAAAAAVPAAVTAEGTNALIAYLVAGTMVLLAAALRLVRVTIDVTATEMVIAFRPLFSRRLALSEITSVTASSSTTAAEVFGYRILGKDHRGLLVGGPSITIRIPDRVWDVSTDDPAAVIDLLEAQASRKPHS